MDSPIPIAKRTRAKKLEYFKEYLESHRDELNQGDTEFVDLVGSDHEENNGGKSLKKDHYYDRRKKRAKIGSCQEPTETAHGDEDVSYGSSEEAESESESEATSDEEFRVSDTDLDVEGDKEVVVERRPLPSSSDPDSEPSISEVMKVDNMFAREVDTQSNSVSSGTDTDDAFDKVGFDVDARGSHHDDRGVSDEGGTEGHSGEARHMGGSKEVDYDSVTIKKECFSSESHEEVVMKGRMYIILDNDNEDNEGDQYDIRNSVDVNGGDDSRGSDYDIDDDYKLFMESGMGNESSEHGGAEEVDMQHTENDLTINTSENNHVTDKVDGNLGEDDSADGGHSDPDDACQGETTDSGISRTLEGQFRDDATETLPLKDYGEKLNLEFSIDDDSEFDEKEEEAKQHFIFGDSKKDSCIERRCSETRDNIGDTILNDSTSATAAANSSDVHKDGAGVDEGGRSSDCHIDKKLEWPENETSGHGCAEVNMVCLSDEEDKAEEVDVQCTGIDPTSDTRENNHVADDATGGSKKVDYDSETMKKKRFLSKSCEEAVTKERIYIILDDDEGDEDDIRNSVAANGGYDSRGSDYGVDDDCIHFMKSRKDNEPSGHGGAEANMVCLSDEEDKAEEVDMQCPAIDPTSDTRENKHVADDATETLPLKDYGEKLNLESSIEDGSEFDEKEEEEAEQHFSFGNSKKDSCIERRWSETGDNIGDNILNDSTSASATVAADSSVVHRDGAGVDEGGRSSDHDIDKKLEGNFPEVTHTVHIKGGYQNNGLLTSDGIGFLPPFVPYLPMSSSILHQSPGPYAFRYPPRYLPPTQANYGNLSRPQRPSKQDYYKNQTVRNQSHRLLPYPMVRRSQRHHPHAYPMVRKCQASSNIGGSGTSFQGGLNCGRDSLHDLNRGPRSKGHKSENSSLTTPIRSKYNKEDFPVDYVNAKFFIIKSKTEDDIHKSIKNNVWTSTSNGSKMLEAEFKETLKKCNDCPVFLFFSVEKSEQFVGLAEMTSGVIGFSFIVKWHIVKDIPYSLFKLTPVMQSEDIQEVTLEQGLVMLKRFKDYNAKTCILDDFELYDEYEDLKRLVQDRAKKYVI